MQVAVDLLQLHAVLADPGVAAGGRRDMALEHDLGARGHLQHHASIANARVDHLGAAAAQQPGELVFGQRVGYRSHGAEDGRRVGAERHRNREWLAGARQREIAEVERAAAVCEPAHDHAVLRDHLLAVDAEVLARTRRRAALRTARDHEAPGNQGTGVVGPAQLHRQPTEVDLCALQDHLLARSAAGRRRLHVPQRLGHLQQLAGVLQALGRLGLFQAGEQPADIAKLAHIVCAHAERDPFRRAEQVCQG